jgi:uncharacterized membrane protein YedE/YeeE
VRLGSSDFSPQADPALGTALRAALDRSGDAEFLRAVLERARVAGVGSSRAVLGRWTRAAVAALLVAALVGGLLAGASLQTPASFETEWVAATTGSPAAAALFTAEDAPDASVLFASVVAD